MIPVVAASRNCPQLEVSLAKSSVPFNYNIIVV
jgi:hypothetical protein